MKFDLLNQKQDKPILCRYGEDGRIIYGTIINSDDEEHTVNLNNFTGIKIQMYKPDGNFVIKDATVSSGHVVIPIDEQMTACAGTGFMDLKLTANDGTIYTCHATVIIDTPVATDETIASISMIDGYVFPDDFQLKLTAGEAIYFTGEDERTINARATAMTEGEGITISGNKISVSSTLLETIDGKQEELTAGAGISISEENVISMTGGSVQSILKSATTSPYGYVRLDLTDSNNNPIPAENVISVIGVTDEGYSVYEPICNGLNQYPIDGVQTVYAHFVTGYNGQNCENFALKYRMFYLPLVLTAEEKHVGEGE